VLNINHWKKKIKDKYLKNRIAFKLNVKYVFYTLAVQVNFKILIYNIW